MQQLVIPDVSINTNKLNNCLWWVQQTVGAIHQYPTAMAEWNADLNNHDGTPPSGYWLPIFFTMVGVPAGHVCWIAPDGSVYSTSSATSLTPVHHASIDALIKYYGGKLTLLGWSEWVSNIRIVEREDMVTNESCYNAFNGILMRPPTQGDLDIYVGKWTLESLIGVLNGELSERQEVLKAYTTGQQALKDDWAGQIKELSSDLVELKPGNYKVN